MVAKTRQCGISLNSMKNEIAVFGGGCFWCTEAIFKMLKGVKSITSGYGGGIEKNPTYEEVSSGETGHAEIIKIEYEQTLVSFKTLLTVFFGSHDPTTLNRQGADVGTQYRSVIFYSTPEQKRGADKMVETLNESGPRAVTAVDALDAFYEAEEHHKNYYEKNTSAPYCQIAINPKLDKLKARFYELLK